MPVPGTLGPRPGPGDKLPITKKDLFPDRVLPAQPPKRPSAVAGRKKCTACGKLPKSMTEHFQSQTGEGFQAHGPISSNNPVATKNLPGLKKISEDLGQLFNNRRSW